VHFTRKLTPGTGIVHFLFEATSAGKGELVFSLQANTAGLPQDIDMSMSGVWFDLKDIEQIYQHFTVGDDINAVPASSASPVSGSPSKADLDEMNFEDDYILFVHGWRMKKWERRAFAETAYKRLYWQGYKGRFGLFSWPTEWTDRPDTWYWDLIGASPPDDQENYMRSDAKAMASGAGLASKLQDLNNEYGANVFVFAHSMGNVVVSEALRNGASVNVFIASQAASVACAYDADGPEVLSADLIELQLDGRGLAGGIFENFHGLDFHPRVFASYPQTSEPYYQGVGINATIVNYHNRQDDALAWWLIGQSRKPNEDYYYEDENDFWYRDDGGLYGTDTLLVFPFDRFEIFARAAEAGSTPLGASVVEGFSTGIEINRNYDLNEGVDFQDGAEDHSAQFRSTIMRRSNYWERLLFDFGLTEL